MTESLKNYIPLIIGWMLGILSSLFVEWIQKHTSKKEIKKGITAELKAIKLNAIGICFLSRLGSGDITREWTKWIRPLNKLVDESELYKQFSLSSTVPNVIDKFTDEHYYEMLSSGSSGEKRNVTRTIAKFSLPYIQAKFDSLSLFSEIYQQKVFIIMREIDTFNNYLDEYWFYHTKTFENLSDVNNDIVRQNLDFTLKIISTRTEVIIKRIDDIIST